MSKWFQTSRNVHAIQSILKLNSHAKKKIAFLAFMMFASSCDKLLLWNHVSASAEGVDGERSGHGNGRMPWY